MTAALHRMTAPFCRGCAPPPACCSNYQCERTIDHARALGVELPRFGGRVPLLGPRGCLAPPLLRTPTCNGYLCRHVQPDDPAWIERWRRRCAEVGVGPW